MSLTDKYYVQHLPKSETELKIEKAVDELVNTVLKDLYKQQEEQNKN